MKTHDLEFSFSQTVKDSVVEFFRPVVQLRNSFSSTRLSDAERTEQVSEVLNELRDGNCRNAEMISDMLARVNQLSEQVIHIEQQSAKSSELLEHQLLSIRKQLDNVSSIRNRISSPQLSSEAPERRKKIGLRGKAKPIPQEKMSIRVSKINKPVEMQKNMGEELAFFFKKEVEKARELKSPEDVIKFNVETNKALFELLKSQGETFTAIANEAREAATADNKLFELLKSQGETFTAIANEAREAATAEFAKLNK